MIRYSVIAHTHWQRDDGLRASIHGAVPYTSDADKARWKMVTRGFTVYDHHSNTYGCGRKPWETREEAQAAVDKFNANA